MFTNFLRSLGLLLIALEIPLLGPCCVMLYARHTGNSKLRMFCLLCGIVQLAAIITVGWIYITDTRGTEQFKKSVYTIYGQVDSYWWDHDFRAVPESLTDLIAQGYLAELPLNPYTGEPVQQVELWRPHEPGTIVYLPAYQIDASGKTIAASFTLIGFGSRWSKYRWRGAPPIPTGAVLVLDTGISLIGADKDGDGIVESKYCVGGLSSDKILKMYCYPREPGWLTLSEYEEHQRAMTPKSP